MQDAPPTRRRPLRWLVTATLVGACLYVGNEARDILFGANIHTVIPGRVYRSAQLTHDRLAALLRERGIRTVVNLRGCCPEEWWFHADYYATAAAGVNQEDFTLSATRLPPPSEVRELVEVLDHSEPPLLLHCARGVDRTGLASALALLLHTDAGLATARRELSLAHGHVALGGTEAMKEFLGMYEDWLNAWEIDHTPATLRHWVAAEYCPGPGRGRIELLNVPAAVRVGSSSGFKIRVWNESRQPWEFRPGTEDGIHLRATSFAANGAMTEVVRVGQFRTTVPSGGSLDLTVPFRAPDSAGEYALWIELMNGRRNSFGQVGCPPVIRPLRITP